jgi:hypothetical protein
MSWTVLTGLTHSLQHKTHTHTHTHTKQILWLYVIKITEDGRTDLNRLEQPIAALPRSPAGPLQLLQ